MTRNELSEEGKRRYDEVLSNLEKELKDRVYVPESGRLDGGADSLRDITENYLAELEKILKDEDTGG